MTQEEKNRQMYPWTASVVDMFREVFGPQVTVKQTTEKPNKQPFWIWVIGGYRINVI